jgi:hypothetical protein
MNDEQKQVNELGALTNQPVEITIGDKSYKARRVTVTDALLMERKRLELEKSGSNQNEAGITATFFLLSLLLQPDNNFTPEQLQSMAYFDQMDSIMSSLQELGFKKPQLKTPVKS